jgi:hypothetical protein
MTFHFKPVCDLRLKKYDKVCELFISGEITYKDFEIYENNYLKFKMIYIISLN